MNYDFCEVVLPTKDSEKILNYSHKQKSINHSFVIFADSETLLEKAGGIIIKIFNYRCEKNILKKLKEIWIL